MVNCIKRSLKFHYQYHTCAYDYIDDGDYRVQRQFCEHSPSHVHGTVHSSAAFLHLQRLTQPILHLHDTTCSS